MLHQSLKELQSLFWGSEFCTKQICRNYKRE